jgi:hypothetical protein
MLLDCLLTSVFTLEVWHSLTLTAQAKHPNIILNAASLHIRLVFSEECSRRMGALLGKSVEHSTSVEDLMIQQEPISTAILPHVQYLSNHISRTLVWHNIKTIYIMLHLSQVGQGRHWF